MTRTTKRRGLIGLSLVVLLVGLWLSLPALARAYIARQFPGVTVARVGLAWSGATLRDVAVNREGVKAHFPEVFVRRDKSVWINGGSVEIDIESLPKGGGSAHAQRPRITGTIDTLTVKKGSVRGRGSKVTIDEKMVCVEAASADHTLGSASVEKGCITLDRSQVTFHKLHVEPSAVGKWVGPTAAVDAEDGFVSLDGSKLTLTRLSYGKAYVLSNISARRTGIRASLTIESAYIHNPILFPTPITVKQITTDVEIPEPVLDVAALRTVLSAVETNVTVWVGASAIVASPKNLSVVGDEACQTWVDSMPAEMRVGPLGSAPLGGRLSFAVHVRPEPKVEITSSCKVTSCAAFDALRSTFEYTAYDAKGQPFIRTSGPKSKNWVPLSAMNPAIPQAVMTLEDPAFRGHKGFLVGAIENSLKANIIADRFVRGGSTITMQLVKNLWLRRDKALARKAQEILLSSAIESCLSKDEIIELYLNVVEFGPDVYGIGAATRHYFAEAPMAIVPVQAFYLASILPAPRKAVPPNAATLARIEKLMRKLSDNGALPEGIDVPEEGSSSADLDPIDTTGWQVNH